MNNTIVYFIFLYIYTHITDDFVSKKIREDKDFKNLILKVYKILEEEYPESIQNIPFDILENPTNKEELKRIFFELREYWGSLPQDYFENEIEDKVSRMIITTAIFNGSMDIGNTKTLLEQDMCTNDKTMIHIDCIKSSSESILGKQVTLFRNQVVDKPGMNITLMNGHFIPYFSNNNRVFFIDMQYVLDDDTLKRAFPNKEVIFMKNRLPQYDEECGLHCIMTVLYARIININPYFIWTNEYNPSLDYKSLGNMKKWAYTHGIDYLILLRALEYISYNIF